MKMIMMVLFFILSIIFGGLIIVSDFNDKNLPKITTVCYDDSHNVINGLTCSGTQTSDTTKTYFTLFGIFIVLTFLLLVSEAIYNIGN